MSTITEEFTKEQLIAKAEEQIKLTRGLNLTLSAKEHVDMCSVLFEIALAAMESKPAYQVFEPSDGRWVDADDEEEMIRLRSIGGETRTLYTAPPAPVSVPEDDLLHIAASAIEDLLSNKDRSGAGVWADIPAKLRRATMLQGADGTLTNEDTKRVGELVMWVKRLAHSLRKANPDSKLQSDAMDYLSRNGLIGVKDILR